MVDERWKPVIGYEGLYEVSDFGSVRSIDRLVKHPKGGNRLIRGQVMVLGDHSGGYKTVRLSKDGRGHTQRVHQLVAVAFLGDRRCGGLEVAHKNGIPSDNRLENLEWKTRSENAKDKRGHGTDPHVNKTACPLGHKLSEPNLRKAQLEKYGRRGCLACHRANTYHRSHPWLDFKTLADGYLEEILMATSLPIGSKSYRM